MVRRFVEQQNVRTLHQRLDNRQTLLPSAGQRRRFHVEVFEAGAAKSFGKASSALRGVNFAALHRLFNHGPHGRARLEFGILLDVADSEPFSERDFARIRILTAGQNSQQRGFAGTVWTDEPDAVALGDGKRHVLKERVRSKGLRNSLNINDWRQRLAVSLVSLLRLSGKLGGSVSLVSSSMGPAWWRQD